MGNLFPRARHSFDIGELIQEKGLMCAVNVGSLLSKDITLSYTSEFMQDRGLMTAVSGKFFSHKS